MPIRDTLLPVKRRFAAGIDLSPREVRLAVLSVRGRGAAPVSVEGLVAAPLAGGAMAGAQIVDREAVAAALAAAFAQLPPACATRKMTCAMAVPGSATVVASVALSRLAPGKPRATRAQALAGVEQAVMAEAERVAGIERHALAVDWFIDDALLDAGGNALSVTIAATPRQHLETRVEVAASAGIELRALDGEPPAALRALRHAAELELNPHERYAALWVGGDGVYGWRLSGDMIEAHLRYPAPEHEDLADALRELGGGGALGCALGCALIGGELELLGSVGVAIADIGDLLGCSVLPFECAPYCDDGSSGVPAELRHAPAFAVAFGLALRGVLE
ncbi:pilus assembly protein PilM [Trinickia terrae]|uniref:Pilus assembly protein PilM n=1 Tax=Trinickia terrae TaxID=2571161 RepID=A0A4U1IB51_9BURK|nr:pilus assembly protein PilM [Trinickia terrae]TKC90786.1 pilus assembly protein PilM [Trinickia terrae]